MAILLRQIYCGSYILRRIYYGRYITADLLRTTTKTAISRQMYSARSSRLLHPNLLVATRRPKDSPGPLYPAYVGTEALYGLPQGRAGVDPKFQEGADAPWKKEFTHKAPGPGQAPFYVFDNLNTYMQNVMSFSRC